MACNSVAIALTEVSDVGAMVGKMMDQGMRDQVLERMAEVMQTVEGVSSSSSRYGSLRIEFKGESYDLAFNTNRWVIRGYYGDEFEHKAELDTILAQATEFVGSELIALQTMVALQSMNAQVLEEEAMDNGSRRIKFRMFA